MKEIRFSKADWDDKLPDDISDKRSQTKKLVSKWVEIPIKRHVEMSKSLPQRRPTEQLFMGPAMEKPHY